MSCGSITPRTTSTTAVVSCSTGDCCFNILQLPPEILAIIFSKSFGKPSFDQLLKFSTVCSQIRHLITNEWFLQKYYFSFFHNVIIWCRFSNESIAGGGIDFLHNSVKTNIVGDKGMITWPTLPQIELNGFFDHAPCLKFSDNNTRIEKRYELNAADSFSVSFWFLAACRTDLPFIYIRFTNEESRLSSFLRINDKNQLEFCATRTTGWITLGQLQMNEWHHIALVFLPSSSETPTMKIYVNSNKTTLEIHKLPIIGPFESLKLELRYVNGSFADLAVWSTVLSSIEVRAIYDQKTTINKVNVAKYILDNWNKE
ncbi:unnamed protein product [Didymodactylos carnosus]|uniref:F-box domain-containing protein n=1 Tax=Didymodactylos carnosus TaxID=1234261 RepID=A0A815Z8X3_9BILA|nr:unnamed protein product [Didymodactylos carnosus]CAF4448301.1 unnamed protein product [Didymodactylos carnosus]